MAKPFSGSKIIQFHNAKRMCEFASNLMMPVDPMGFRLETPENV